MDTRRRTGIKLALSLATTGLCLEVALRVAPACIPTKSLVYFREDLRSRIAQGRFATRADSVRVARDDGGPELRIWKPFIVKPYFLSDPGSVESVRADELGFSNPPGTCTSNVLADVVTIGDSFTWAHAVNPTDTWSFRLGRLTGLRVVNLGKGGTGPYEYLQIYRHFGAARRPRVVVMNIYEGNDIRDALAYHAYRGTGGEDDHSQSALWKRIPVLSGSYTYNLIAASVEYGMAGRRNKRSEGTIDFRYWVDPDRASILFNEQQGARDEVVYPRKVVSGEAGFEAFDAALQAFAALAAEQGFTPVLMYSPAACIAYAPVRFSDPAVGEVLTEFSRRQREYFAMQAKQKGLVFLDLTGALQAAAYPVDGSDSRRLLYYTRSLHYTARGHEVVARTLAPVVSNLVYGAGAPE